MTLNKLLYTALSQIGVKESGANNICYNTWYYGHPVLDSAQIGAYAWCVVFLSWCADRAGLLNTVIPKENNVSRLMRYYQQIGCYRDSNPLTVPAPGEIIFFQTSGGRHVGLVIASDGKRVATVEGNTSNAVRMRDYALNDSQIAGYAMPRYDAHSSTDVGESNASAPDGEENSISEVISKMQLKLGDCGEAVRSLQIRLLYEGYSLGNFGPQKDGVDGKFGKQTRDAVLDFQKKHGLDADGIAGKETLAKLYGLA